MSFLIIYTISVIMGLLLAILLREDKIINKQIALVTFTWPFIICAIAGLLMFVLFCVLVSSVMGIFKEDESYE